MKKMEKQWMKKQYLVTLWFWDVLGVEGLVISWLELTYFSLGGQKQLYRGKANLQLFL